MKFKFFLISIIFFVIISCTKDGGNGLSISLASVSNNVVPVSGTTTITLNFKDNGSHIIDSVFMHKIRINQDSSFVETVRDTIYLIPPTYPSSVKGQLQFVLDNTDYLASAASPPQVGNPPANESDSLIIRFSATDVANNKSDTISTGLIIVQR